MSVNNPNDPNLSASGRDATDAEAARRNAYVKGRNDEHNVQRQVNGYERASNQAAANNGAASGLLVGLLIALLVGGAGALLYFMSGDRTAPVSLPDTDINIEVPEVEIPEVNSPDVNIEVPDVEVPDVDITDELPGEAGE